MKSVDWLAKGIVPRPPRRNSSTMVPPPAPPSTVIRLPTAATMTRTCSTVGCVSTLIVSTNGTASAMSRASEGGIGDCGTSCRMIGSPAASAIRERWATTASAPVGKKSGGQIIRRVAPALAASTASRTATSVPGAEVFMITGTCPSTCWATARSIFSRSSTVSLKISLPMAMPSPWTPARRAWSTSSLRLP